MYAISLPRMIFLGALRRKWHFGEASPVCKLNLKLLPIFQINTQYLHDNLSKKEEEGSILNIKIHIYNKNIKGHLKK